MMIFFKPNVLRIHQSYLIELNKKYFLISVKIMSELYKNHYTKIIFLNLSKAVKDSLLLQTPCKRHLNCATFS